MVRKRVSWFLILSIVALILTLFYINYYRDFSYASTMTSESLQDDEYERLIKLVFLKELQEASNSYYKDYYTINPTVEYFSSTIDKIYREQGLTYVNFTILPFLGPHETVGIDTVTLSVDTWGTVTMVKYTHTGDFKLPPNLSDLQKTRSAPSITSRSRELLSLGGVSLQAKYSAAQVEGVGYLVMDRAASNP